MGREALCHKYLYESNFVKIVALVHSVTERSQYRFDGNSSCRNLVPIHHRNRLISKKWIVALLWLCTNYDLTKLRNNFLFCFFVWTDVKGRSIQFASPTGQVVIVKIDSNASGPAFNNLPDQLKEVLKDPHIVKVSWLS